MHKVGRGREGTKKFQFLSKEKGYHQWIDLPEFPPLPECHSTKYSTMIGVGSKLYVAGGWCSSRDATGNLQSVCQSAFHVYDSKYNQWFPLKPMLRGCYRMALVHHDGCIYAIGGQDSSHKPIPNFQCYNILQQCWVDMTPMPLKCREISAVTFKNKILVSGIQQRGRKTSHVLIIYCPVGDKWKIIENTIVEYMDFFGDILVPLLFIHKDQCYRVLCRYRESESLIDQVFVNALDFNSEDVSDGTVATISNDNVDLQDGELQGSVSSPTAKGVSQEVETFATIGEEIKQDEIPDQSSAFRIDDEVFVILMGFVYKTGVKISSLTLNGDLSSAKHHLGGWNHEYYRYSQEEFFVRNVTYLRFDKKKLRGTCHDQSNNETESV